MLKFLDEMNLDTKVGLTLMEKIKMSTEIAYYLKDGIINMTPSNSEIGIFGIVIYKDGKIVKNQPGGVYVKTKPFERVK